MSEGEIVDEEVEDNAEVANAVEAAMVAARRQAQGKVAMDEDIVVLESSEEDDEEGIDDGNDEDVEGGRQGNKHIVRVEEEEEPEEVMEDVDEDLESSQLQYPEQSDDRRSTANVSRETMSDRGGNSIVPEFGEMTATSSQRIPGDLLQDAGIPHYQEHAPESSSSVAAAVSQHSQEAQGGHQFEDGKDDSVVPSTPKLGDGILNSSRGVPGSSSTVLNIGLDDTTGGGAISAPTFAPVATNTFVFASHSNTRGDNLGTSNVTSSSNRSNFDISSGVSGTVPDLALQHGLDRTSIDIAQFTTSQTHVSPQDQPTSGDRTDIMISSAMSPQRSPNIPSTSRGK